ncbi:ABC transporter ATP-binding protein [Nonomuraea sp. NPDC004186]
MAARPQGELSRGTPAAAETVVTATGIVRVFGDAVVLDGVDLRIRRGEVVALLGANGSGKSTLLRILAGLDSEADGEVSTIGRTAAVFQEHRLLPWKRIADNIALGLRGPDVSRRTEVALAEVGLADRGRAWPAELSGGQAQRVAPARALVREPDILLLDEPFAALEDADPVGDGVVYRQAAVWLSDDEFAAMIEEIEKAVVTRIGRTGGQGRTRRIVSLVVVPDKHAGPPADGESVAE